MSFGKRPRADADAILKAALRYAARGWRMFPVRPGHKAPPLISDFPRRATTKTKRIEEWWERWPTANIAIATGRDSDITVCDLDVTKDGDGHDTAKLLGLPDTLRARTPSGGTHLYYGYTKRLSTSVKPVPAIDVRNDGGYVLAPPSVLSNGAYTWGPDLEIATLPLKVVERWHSLSSSRKDREGSPYRLPATIGEGRRNAELASYAGHLRAQGKDQEAILAALRAANDERCDPPLSDKEVRAIAGSISRYAPGPSLAAVNNTELGNALRFQQLYANQLRHVRALRQWYAYDATTGLWLPDETGNVLHRALEIGRAIQREAAAITDNEERKKRLFAWGLQSESVYTAEATLKAASSLAPIATLPRELDTDDYVIGTQNGVLDLRTGKLLPPDPARLVTKRAGFEFDPQALCPQWLHLLDLSIRDEERIAYLQEFFGYVLSGSVQEHALIFLSGEGRSGKSRLVETVHTLLGDYAKGISTEALMYIRTSASAHSDEIASLLGARLATANETGQTQSFDEALIKRLTGDDTITARGLYKSTINFAPKFKLMIRGNYKPRWSGSDGGMRRRLVLIETVGPIPKKEQNNRIQDLLNAELSGIANWALSGFKRWYRRGKLAVPESITKATDDYAKEQNAVARWLADCTTSKPTPEKQREPHDPKFAAMRPREAFVSFRRWCEAGGLPLIPKNEMALLYELERLHGLVRTTYRGNTWLRGKSLKVWQIGLRGTP